MKIGIILKAQHRTHSENTLASILRITHWLTLNPAENCNPVLPVPSRAIPKVHDRRPANMKSLRILFVMPALDDTDLAIRR